MENLTVGADPRVCPNKHAGSDKTQSIDPSTITNTTHTPVGADPRVCPDTRAYPVPRVCPDKHAVPDKTQSIDPSTITNTTHTPVGADPRVCPGTRAYPDKTQSIDPSTITNTTHTPPVGADPRVCPDTRAYPVPRVCPDKHAVPDKTQSIDPSTITNNINTDEINAGHLEFTSTEHWGEHAGSPLHTVIQWFKTMTTNNYIRNVKHNGWPPFNGKLWQRNYFEHIIRNEQSYQRIAEYIYNNPVNWAVDKFYVRPYHLSMQYLS